MEDNYSDTEHISMNALYHLNFIVVGKRNDKF